MTIGVHHSGCLLCIIQKKKKYSRAKNERSFNVIAILYSYSTEFNSIIDLEEERNGNSESLFEQ